MSVKQSKEINNDKVQRILANYIRIINSVIYDTKVEGYRLQYNNVYKLFPQQILAICKILLDSRAFVKKEMTETIDKLIHSSVVKNDQPQVVKLTQNEEEHYVELQGPRGYGGCRKSECSDR